MNGSSSHRAGGYDGLEWAQVETLVEVLRESELRTLWRIEQRYRERAGHFDETLAFLQSINLVKRNAGRIVLEQELAESGHEALPSLVVDRVLRSPGRYRAEMVRYLRRFRMSNGVVSCRSDISTRSKESAVRNFLMGMNVIHYEVETDLYVITPERVSLYVLVRGRVVQCPPSYVARSAAGHDDLGLAAETAVVGLERERVGTRLAHRVEHVALRNAAAGYDVLSVAATTPADATLRYIEVKAVSPRSLRFFWTKNEVMVAHLLGDLYYLYLLPVGPNGRFLTDRLVVIPDAYGTVLAGGDGWAVEPDVLLCQSKELYLGKNEGPRCEV